MDEKTQKLAQYFAKLVEQYPQWTKADGFFGGIGKSHVGVEVFAQYASQFEDTVWKMDLENMPEEFELLTPESFLKFINDLNEQDPEKYREVGRQANVMYEHDQMNRGALLKFAKAFSEFGFLIDQRHLSARYEESLNITFQKFPEVRSIIGREPLVRNVEPGTAFSSEIPKSGTTTPTSQDPTKAEATEENIEDTEQPPEEDSIEIDQKGSPNEPKLPKKADDAIADEKAGDKSPEKVGEEKATTDQASEIDRQKAEDQITLAPKKAESRDPLQENPEEESVELDAELDVESDSPQKKAKISETSPRTNPMIPSLIATAALGGKKKRQGEQTLKGEKKQLPEEREEARFRDLLGDATIKNGTLVASGKGRKKTNNQNIVNAGGSSDNLSNLRGGGNLFPIAPPIANQPRRKKKKNPASKIAKVAVGSGAGISLLSMLGTGEAVANSFSLADQWGGAIQKILTFLF